MNISKFSVTIFAVSASLSPLFAQGPAMPVVSVAADVVSTNAYSTSYQYTGRILSPETVTIIPQVSGEIVEVAFTEGASVKKGDLLYRIDDVKYKAAVASASAAIAQAEAGIAQASASADYANKSFDRIKALFEKNVTSTDDMDAAATAKQSALASLSAAKANLSAAQAALISAEDNLAHCRIIAPIDGKVGINHQSLGNFVSTASGPLTTIVRENPLRLSFSMATGDLLRSFANETNLSQNFLIKIRLGDRSVYPEAGIIEFIDNAANALTDSVIIYAKIANPNGVLIPGSTVTVEVNAKTPQSVVTAPLTSIVRDENGAFVWILDENDVPSRRDITTFNQTESSAIIASGLTPGDRIITTGTHKVIPNCKVNIVPANGMGPETPSTIGSSNEASL